MTMIEEALTQTTDTTACEIGPGATEAAARMFGELFPVARVTLSSPRTALPESTLSARRETSSAIIRDPVLR